ncbi:MAG: ABC transporter substrate-binding protein [Microthrixaceae bacterium]
MKNRFVHCVTMLVALAVVAASCGGGDSDSAEGTSDAGELRYGGDIVYGLEAENSGGWCLPEGQLAISGIMVARAIYDTLTIPDADAQYVPFLAESVEPNGDFTQWSIKLRDGVTFHDGTPLDATVVKNNLDAFRGTYPARQPLLLRFIFDPIADVSVVDDLTVSVTTKVPWPAFPASLFSEGRAGISAQAQLDDPETCDRNLIGTGPFRFEEWVQNDRLVVTRNDDYWRTDADGNQLPYLDRVEFRPYVDATTRANALLSDEIQMGLGGGATEFAIWQDAAEAGEIQVLKADQYPEVGFQIINVGTEPFNNRNARIAAAAALDRDEINDIRNQGLLRIADGPFGPGNMGYLEDTGYPDFDLDRAREAAAAYEAETGKPLTFTYTYQADPETTQLAQLLQEQWGRAGIEVNLASIEQSALISTAISGEYQVISFRNHGGGDPDVQYIWWYGGSPLNFGRIDDPRINDLLDRGRSSSDAAERTQIYEEINTIMGEEAYAQWITWVDWVLGFRNDLHGVMGPQLPDGAEPFPGLAAGHTLAGVWISGS